MSRAALAALALVLAGCTAAGAPYDPADIRDATGHLPGDDLAECPQHGHNARGGFVAACGELPGILGDDC